MTKLTDALRRLAAADDDGTGAQPTAPAAAPAAGDRSVRTLDAPRRADQTTVGRTGSATISADPRAIDQAAAVARPDRQLAVPPDVRRLREFVTDDLRRHRGRRSVGSVLVLLSPPGVHGDARTATARLIGELAAALGDRPGDDVLVIDVPPAGQPVQSLEHPAEPAAGGGSVAQLIRSRARLADVARAAGSPGVWRAADDRLPLRSPPAPWPALVGLLDECRQRYAWTLIDAGAWDAAESAELARRCDSVYVVLHEGQTGRMAARRTLGELRRAGAAVSSCLFVERPRHGLPTV